MRRHFSEVLPRSCAPIRILFLVAAILVPLVLACGQDAPLTKDQVIQMSKAGISDDVIITRINAEPNAIKLNTDDLIALKSAGVSDPVIKALVAGPAPASAPAAAAAPSAPPMADPNDPMSPHDPGIYMMAHKRDGGKEMVLIDRAGSGHEKTANIWGHAFSYGISKAKLKAELPGAHAAIRSTDPKPDFYMYFPPVGNLGAADTISSPSQFTLLSLEIKKDHRETAVAKVGFASASAGTDEKRIIKFDSDKLKPYIYHITPDGNMPAGEYAFVASTGMGGTASPSAVVMYDFGVDLQ